MKKMNTICALALMAGLLGAAVVPQSATAAEPEGVVTYSLPSTTISLSVEAVQEKFTAGPYAKFAAKYLGIDARQADEVKYHIEKVSMTPYLEADLSSRFDLIADGQIENNKMLALSSAGLVALENGAFGEERVWRFPAAIHTDFSDKGVSSNLRSESATLFSARKKSSFDKVLQEVTLEKSIEQKAQEAAEMILNLRKNRIQIVTGDTDATYSGEAMGAAIAELKALEKEYLSLFTGYTEYKHQRANFDIIPQQSREPQMMIAFRLSDTEGLRPATTESGRPVVMQIVPDALDEKVADAKSKVKAPKNAQLIHYRIPATCTVNIMEGTRLLLQGRMPVYQMGIETSIPVVPVK